MEWISHDDRTLKEHLYGLKKVVENFLPEKEQAFFSKEELNKKLFALIAYHDLAKASIYFQLYLSHSLTHNEKNHRDYHKDELEKFITENKIFFDKWQANPRLKEHSLFGAWMSLYFFGNTIDYSLDPFLFLSILKAHHGHLKNFNLATLNLKDQVVNLIETYSSIDFDNYSKIMDSLGLPFQFGNMAELLDSFRPRKFDMLAMGLRNNKDSSYYFKTLFLYSLLLSADKGDMMLQEKELHRLSIQSKIIDEFKKSNIKSNHSIDKWREEAYQTAISRVNRLGSENFYSITLPTGLGKTFTAYKTALQIKEKYCPDFRIIYCLPFTSIIDQNALIFKKILINSGIEPELIGVHHHLSIPQIKKDDEDNDIFANWEYLTEGWQNEITITTFVQLWESIFACHNKQLRKFHNLVNSIIILDEVQSINPKLFPAFEFVMENMARYFNTRFIFVTATQPILLKEKVKELCFKKKSDYFFTKVNRTIIDTSLINEGIRMSEEELAEIVLKGYEDIKQSILVICNTIRFSQNLIKILAASIAAKDLFYLSASLIPYTREKRLDKEIKIRLKNKDSIVLISTQVVEAGVDIDFDLVYRDFAPLSSINQAAGRCNRNAERGISKVILFKSGKEKIYDPTQLDITKNVLNSFNPQISENQFFELNKRFFEAVKNKIQDGSGVSANLMNDILMLNFESVGTNSDYRLIKENYMTYNYFIAINNSAEELWDKYLNKFKIQEHFKRKEAIKLIMPELLRYVVRIPDYVLIPTEEEKEKTIIKYKDWDVFYDETYGYKLFYKENKVEVF